MKLYQRLQAQVVVAEPPNPLIYLAEFTKLGQWTKTSRNLATLPSLLTELKINM